MEALVCVVDDNLSSSCLQGACFPLDDGVWLMDKSMYSLFWARASGGGGLLGFKDVFLPFFSKLDLDVYPLHYTHCNRKRIRSILFS